MRPSRRRTARWYTTIYTRSDLNCLLTFFYCSTGYEGAFRGQDEDRARADLAFPLAQLGLRYDSLSNSSTPTRTLEMIPPLPSSKRSLRPTREPSLPIPSVLALLTYPLPPSSLSFCPPLGPTIKQHPLRLQLARRLQQARQEVCHDRGGRRRSHARPGSGVC